MAPSTRLSALCGVDFSVKSFISGHYPTFVHFAILVETVDDCEDMHSVFKFAKIALSTGFLLRTVWKIM